MMSSALIGYSGFVGTTLLKQQHFDSLFKSDNVKDIEGRHFDTVVCAAAPAQKWIANRSPEADRENIERLMGHLKKVSCDRFILISTVDVFSVPIGVNEQTPVNEKGLHPYGLHRRALEKFVEAHFQHSLIVRLPGLVGPRLRKNIIFDFLNDNSTNLIDTRDTFQFYPTVNLWYDIRVSLEAGLRLVHLASEPIRVYEVSKYGFGRGFEQVCEREPVKYDMQSNYVKHFGVTGNYQYSRRETLQAIRAYAQSEPRTLKASP